MSMFLLSLLMVVVGTIIATMSFTFTARVLSNEEDSTEGVRQEILPKNSVPLIDFTKPREAHIWLDKETEPVTVYDREINGYCLRGNYYT